MAAAAWARLTLPPFVKNPFTDKAEFDYAGLAKAARLAIRMLDNVLTVTHWPLEQQKDEADSKRRVGLGFTGLGDALIMLGMRYDTPQAREEGRKISEYMRNRAY